MRNSRREVLEAWVLGSKSEFVFYSLETGKPLVDRKLGWTRLVNRGVDRVTLQQLLGPAAVTATLHYTHTNLGSTQSMRPSRSS